MSLNSIYNSRQKKIQVLGQYSACISLRPESGRIIVDTGEPAEKGATTNILSDLAAELNLEQSASASVITLWPSLGHRVPTGETTNGRPRPLLTVEVLERMKDRVTAYPLSIIGVESTRVREDTALWLLDGLGRSGPTRYHSGGDLVGLARRLAIQAGAPGLTVVGQLRGFKPASSVPLSSLVLGWQHALLETKKTGTRIALLCPVEVSEWVRRQGRSEELWVESHYEREYLLPDPFAEWLMWALLPMELGLAGGDVLRLADLMLTDAVSRRPVSDAELTWWPDMLGLWLQRLTGDLPSPSDLAPPDKGVIAYEQIDWLRRLWIDLLDEMQRVTTALEPTFELKPVLRVPPEPPNNIDFDIRAREPEAQPGDVAPTDDSKDDGGNSEGPAI